MFTCFGLHAQLSVGDLKTENRKDPVGLDHATPRFSWKVSGKGRDLVQTAYEIQVSAAANGSGDVWRSGKVSSSASVWIPYGGAPLVSLKNYFWKVRVWDGKGKPSAWSPIAFWQSGLLEPGAFTARWISVKRTEPATETSDPAPLFRKTFSTSKKIATATATITAQGVYEAFINGARIGTALLAPGWTSYNNRLQYQQYDVTRLLQQGNNAIGVAVGNGWYKGYIGFSGQHDFYGKDLALWMQLDITYSDGTRERIQSDDSWQSSYGTIRYSEIYHGETIDARIDQAGWNMPAGNTTMTWTPVRIKEQTVNLIGTYNEPITRHETFRPVRIFTTPKGEQVIDFGQNLVGWVQVMASGKAGDRVTISHAEVLDKAGNFYTENLRPARQRNVFILSGKGTETFEPHFTFQGFRYIRVEGYPGELKPENFLATALYSDMRPTGSFTSSHPLINQLQHNIQWGQRGNFLDVPTDCPQRDERLGWTGDAQAFARTATFNFDVHNFMAKWLRDVEADQINGSVPFVVPNVLGPGAAGSAGWADAATIIPFDLYLAYGDRRVLEQQYESMKGWVGYMQRNSDLDLWNKGFHFGDWLFYRPFDDNDGRSAVTDKYLIAQCFYAHSVSIVQKTARILGRSEDEKKYSDLLNRVKMAFVREYMTSSGRLVSGTQTAYVLALNFDMLPGNLRQAAADRLAENIRSYDNHLTTGFLGTPYLCHVLSRFGHAELAYQLLLQESYPSWLYPVKMGATTIWERWDGIKPDSTFQTPGMNSFNHYAYGAIGDWMYRVVAGIDTQEQEPGYRKVTIRPLTGKGLSAADASLETLYGTVRSAWKREGERLELAITIAPNTSATVWIPASSIGTVTEGGKPLGNEWKPESIDGHVKVEVGSGSYLFSVNNTGGGQ